MNFLRRIQAAARVVLRGSMAPFDRPLLGDAMIGPDRLREAYRQSVWVFAAVRHISRPCAAIRLEHSAEPKRGRGSRPESLNDERLDAFWQSPEVSGLSWAGFLLASIGWRKLAGECFWLLGDDSLVPFPEVRESLPKLILARPDRMRHVVDGGKLVGWEFTDGAGRRHPLTPEQVVHLKQWNPYDEWRGLGEYEAAQLAAETDSASARFARNLASAQGDQGVYVVSKGGVLEDNQRTQVMEQLREKRALQQRGIFRPVFLTGDITVEDPKIRSVDTAFLESRRMSAAEVYVAFGVPPSMAKEQASYSIGSASDYFRLILDTCMPEAAEIAGGLSRVSSLLTGRPVFSWFAWDDHPVLQEVRKERMGSLDSLWAKGMPMAAASEYLDLDLPRFPGDDVGWLPISVVPAGEAASPSLDPGPEGDTGGDQAAEDPDEPEADPVRAAISVLRGEKAAKRATRSPADLAAWRRHMRQRGPTVKAYERAFTRVLSAARGVVLAKIASRGSRKGQEAEPATVTRPGDNPGCCALLFAKNGIPVTRAGALDLMYDPDEFLEGLIQGHRKVSEGALTAAGKQVFAELGKDDPFNYPPERVMQFLRERQNRLRDVADSVFEGIRSEIEAGLEAGDTMDQLAARVRAAFNEASRSRAKRIAMTETAAAYGVGRQEGMTQAGVRFKRWLTSGGDNVRPAHMEANNQTVGTEEAFDVGGESLMHPGDPAGSPGNIINCHCVAVAVADPDEGLNP